MLFDSISMPPHMSSLFHFEGRGLKASWSSCTGCRSIILWDRPLCDPCGNEADVRSESLVPKPFPLGCFVFCARIWATCSSSRCRMYTECLRYVGTKNLSSPSGSSGEANDSKIRGAVWRPLRRARALSVCCLSISNPLGVPAMLSTIFCRARRPAGLCVIE